MLTLLLLALLHLSTLFGELSADEATTVTGKPLILHLNSCPNNTSFFRQGEAQGGSEACYLCYCKDGDNAECWIRESWRCDVENKEPTKSGPRVKRSPAGFSELFFRDAARDLFNLRQPEQCNPFGESYSEGCPPDDWCIGCTICDCDANGRWDCHVLSFCDDEKGNKTMKKWYKGELRKGRGQRTRTTTTTTLLITKMSTAKPNKRDNKKWFKMTRKPIEDNVPKQTQIPKLKEHERNNGPMLKNKATKPFVIRKNFATKNPLVLNHKTKPLIKRDNTKSNNSVTYAKNLARNLLGTVNKIIVKSIKDQSKQLQAKQNKQELYTGNENKVKSVVESANIDNKVNTKDENVRRGKAKKGFVKKVVKRKVINKHVMKMQDNENLHRNKRSVSDDNQTNDSTTVVYGAGHSTKPGHLEINVDNVDLIDLNNVLRDPNFYQINDMNITDTKMYTIKTISHLNNTHGTSLPNETLDTFELKNDGKVYEIIPNNLKRNQSDSTIISAESKNEPQNKDILIESDVGEVNFNKSDSYELTEANSKQQLITNNGYTNDVKQTTDTKNERFISTVSYDNDLSPNKWEKIIDLDGKIDKLFSNIIKTEKDVSVNQNNLIFPTETETTFKINSNVSKIITNSPLNRLAVSNKIMSKNNRVEYLPTNNNTDNKIDSWLNKWYKGYKIKTAAPYTPKKKKFNFLKYFRNLFGGLFDLNTKKQTNMHKRKNMLNILCNNNCVINPKKMPQLQLQLKALYHEANKILRILKILKGLLRILDFDLQGEPLKKNKTDVNNFMNDDMQKLNAVLKRKYDDNINKLSDSQIRQIEYIKNNTYEFIKSMEAFYCILSQIIRTLNTHNYNKDIKIFTKNHVRTTREFKENQTMEQSLAKFQNLIATYNLAQNKFLRQLHEALRNLEGKYPRKIETKRNFMPKASVKKNKQNYAASIEMFTKNIIDNLRRLRNLAMRMNSNNRRKRETMYNDGTVEYLLTLMEFFLKHHFPLRKQVESVHDGIDLLLQVISNAPDIKGIKHEHSQNPPLNIIRRMLNTTETNSPLYPTNNDIGDVSSSDIPKIGNNISTANKNEIESSQQSSNDDENDNIMQNYKNNTIHNLTESVAQQSINSVFNKSDLPVFERETTISVDIVTEAPTNFQDIYKYLDNNSSVENVFESALQSRLSDVKENIETSSTPTKIIQEKEIYINSEQSNEDHREFIEKNNYNAYTVEVEKEQEVDVLVTTTEASSEVLLSEGDQEYTKPIVVASLVPKASVSKLKPLRAKYYLPDLEDLSGNETVMKNDKNNWIDEVYEHEFKEYLVTNESTSQSTTIQTDSAAEEKLYARNIRAKKLRIQKEPKKETVDIIMQKKQLDLLNSLDYETEKTEIVHSHDEENSGNGFPNFLS